jgi:hypothetical protein
MSIHNTADEVLPSGFKRDADTEAITHGEQEICVSPLYLRALFKDAGGMAWGRLFVVRDLDGAEHEIEISNAELEDQGYIKRFKDAGLILSPVAAVRHRFRELIEGWLTTARVIHVSRLGWMDDAKTIYLPPMGPPIVKSGAKVAHTYKWKDQPQGFNREPRGSVAAFASGIDGVDVAMPHVALGILHGLAGPGIGLLDLPNLGLFFAGKTSTGKSTAAIAVAAMASDPEARKGNRVEARGTANAIERFAASCSGTACVIDDLENGAAELASDVIYMLGNGSTKMRLTSQADARPVYPIMHVAYCLGAERAPAELRDIRKGAMLGGAIIRCPVVNTSDIPATDPETYTRVKAALVDNAGTPLRAFVARLIDHDRKAYADAYKARLAELSAGLNTPQARAMQVLAMAHVNGDLAKAWGILPSSFDVAGVIDWARDRVATSQELEGLTDSNVFDRVASWLTQRISLGQRLGEEVARPGVVPFYYGDDVVYLPADTRREIAAAIGCAESALRAALRQHLVAGKAGEYTHSRLPGNERLSHWRLMVPGFFRVERDRDGLEKVEAIAEAMRDAVH